MAALAAWSLKATAGTPPLKVVTFAAAKPGDAAFRGRLPSRRDRPHPL